jgi:hypothetical protein
VSVVGVRLNTGAGTSLVIATASATEPSSSPLALTQFTTSHARRARRPRGPMPRRYYSGVRACIARRRQAGRADDSLEKCMR